MRQSVRRDDHQSAKSKSSKMFAALPGQAAGTRLSRARHAGARCRVDGYHASRPGTQNTTPTVLHGRWRKEFRFLPPATTLVRCDAEQSQAGSRQKPTVAVDWV